VNSQYAVQLPLVPASGVDFTTSGHVAMEKLQSAKEETHNWRAGDVMVPVRRMPVEQMLPESVEERLRLKTTGLLDEYLAHEAQTTSSRSCA
jgi:hypothetical protein